MTSRMEQVAERMALAALRTAAANAAEPPEKFTENLPEGWTVPGSERPVNDAMKAAKRIAGEKVIMRVWQPAVEETVEEYFESAKRSFRKGEYCEGAEILTGAVQATLGNIAATRNWPHGEYEDMYGIAAALGSGTGWAETEEEFLQALDNRSEEGEWLAAALGASTGLPESIAFGTYADAPETAWKNGLSFAETVIELANRLAAGESVKA